MGIFLFLEDFFSEPIAMYKILLYVESTEIHIAGENDMKRLAWLSVEDYAATQMELVVVSAMKGYKILGYSEWREPARNPKSKFDNREIWTGKGFLHIVSWPTGAGKGDSIFNSGI